MNKLLFVWFFCTAFYGAGGNSEPPKDPLAGINYRTTFKLAGVYKEFSDVTEQLGVADNVASPRTSSNSYSLIASDESVSNPERFEAFQKACIEHLRKQRLWTLSYPARESLTLLALMVGATYICMEFVGGGSFGGSFAIFAVLFNSVWFVRDIIRSSFNMISTPSHPLDVREKLYVTNQCFIPNAIWPKIEQGFMQARTNQFEESNALAFLDFALGFTALKKQPALTSDSEVIKRSVFARVNRFFADYEMPAESVTAYIVQANVDLFIDAIFGYSTVRPRPVFLVGEGGIGKTKFAHVIYEAISESLRDKVQFCNEVIAQPDDLEGSATKPGLFLKVAQQMHKGGLCGSVIMLDEATWLNADDHVSPAKRTFNGDLTNQKTLYFGSGPLGQGVEFSLPPMLVIVASNSNIEDAALASRFDRVNFSNPKKESLTRYATTLMGGALNASETSVLDSATSFRNVQELASMLLTKRKYTVAV
jgi:hypothetical protein